MNLDAHPPLPIRRPGAEPRTDVTAGGGLAWGSAPPRELDGVGFAPKAVTRAIEDLQRSGYRPLHARVAAGALVGRRAPAGPGVDV